MPFSFHPFFHFHSYGEWKDTTNFSWQFRDCAVCKLRKSRFIGA